MTRVRGAGKKGVFNLGRSSLTFSLNPYVLQTFSSTGDRSRAFARVLKLVKNTGSSSGRDSYNET